jgi:hypothetical protein
MSKNNTQATLTENQVQSQVAASMNYHSDSEKEYVVGILRGATKGIKDNDKVVDSLKEIQMEYRLAKDAIRLTGDTEKAPRRIQISSI